MAIQAHVSTLLLRNVPLFSVLPEAQLALLTAKSTEARSTYDLYLAAADLARLRGRPIPLPTGGTVPVRSNSGLSSAPSNR